MRISDTIMETLLGRAKLVTPEQLTTLKIEAARSVRPLAETVIAQKVADIYELSLEEVARITTDNSTTIFNR